MSAAPLDRLRGTLDSLGWLNGGLYLLDRALRAATGQRLRLYKYVFVAQPLGSPLAKPLRADPKTLLPLVSPDDQLVKHFPRPATVIAQRYAAGAHCLAATVDGSFAGYLWWQRDGYDEDEVRCRYVLSEPSTSVWDFDVYVEPRYRLGRTMARLWQQADSLLAAQGARYSFSRISAFNAASLKAHARLGASARASALFLVAGPVQLSFFSTWPLLHLSVFPGARPVLRLAPP